MVVAELGDELRRAGLVVDVGEAGVVAHVPRHDELQHLAAGDDGDGDAVRVGQDEAAAALPGEDAGGVDGGWCPA